MVPPLCCKPCALCACAFVGSADTTVCRAEPSRGLWALAHLITRTYADPKIRLEPKITVMPGCARRSPKCANAPLTAYTRPPEAHGQGAVKPKMGYGRGYDYSYMEFCRGQLRVAVWQRWKLPEIQRGLGHCVYSAYRWCASCGPAKLRSGCAGIVLHQVALSGPALASDCEGNANGSRPASVRRPHQRLASAVTARSSADMSRLEGSAYLGRGGVP